MDLTRDQIENLIKETEEKLGDLKKFGKNSNYIGELSNLAFLQLEIENYIESEKNLFICLKHFKNQRDRLGQAAVLGIMGTLYFKKKEYLKSSDYYKKAFEIYKELNQKEEQITCLKGIGNSYIKLKRLDDASDIFLECSAICSENEDIYNFLDCLGNLIFIHEKQENWDIVFELYKKSLKSFKQLSDVKGTIISYFNLGILRKKSLKYNEALTYFKKGTNLSIKSNFTELIIKGLGFLGEALFYIGKIKDAKNKFIKALHLAKQINADDAIVQLKVLLKSLGLTEEDINIELKQYQEKQN